MHLSELKFEPGEAIYGGTEDVCWSNHKRASPVNGCKYLVPKHHKKSQKITKKITKSKK